MEKVFWELIKNGEVLTVMEQDAEDFRRNGKWEMLPEIIPTEHMSVAAECGKWDRLEFNYSVDGDVYKVRYWSPDYIEENEE